MARKPIKAIRLTDVEISSSNQLEEICKYSLYLEELQRQRKEFESSTVLSK